MERAKQLGKIDARCILETAGHLIDHVSRVTYELRGVAIAIHLNGVDSCQRLCDSLGDLRHDIDVAIGGKVAVVRWHAINNRSADSCAVGSYITAYQNKQKLSRGFAADLQEDHFSSQGLAPGGECDGVSIFDLNDMSPIEVKVDGVGAGSNSLDQTFELE